jgi:hypothetical protein
MKGSYAMTNAPTSNTSATELRNLSTALTFHASFDQGPNADFALGDNQLYTAKNEQDTDDVELSPGITDSSLSIAKGEGKYGDALAFTRPSDKFLSYKAERNVTYSHEKFQGTASFWMRLDPAEIGGQYADPFQLTDKNFSDDCIWIDFTKNDTPSDFRMGVFGDQNEWDTKKLRANSQEFFWRLAKITEPPFAKANTLHALLGFQTTVLTNSKVPLYNQARSA